MPQCAKQTSDRACAVIETNFVGTPTIKAVHYIHQRDQLKNEVQESFAGFLSALTTEERQPELRAEWSNGGVQLVCAFKLFDVKTAKQETTNETRVWIDHYGKKLPDDAGHEVLSTDYKVFPIGKRIWIRGLNETYYCQDGKLYNE